MKYLITIRSSSFFCAAVPSNKSELITMDSDYSHFSFAVFGVDPLVFCDKLEEVCNKAFNATDYFYNDFIEIKTSDFYDTIRISRDCRDISITRGNLKVLYHADVGALLGLTKAIRKEYRRYESKTVDES